MVGLAGRRRRRRLPPRPADGKVRLLAARDGNRSRCARSRRQMPGRWRVCCRTLGAAWRRRLHGCHLRTYKVWLVHKQLSWLRGVQTEKQ